MDDYSKCARSRFELAACSARVERPSVYGPCRVSGGWGLPSLGGTPGLREVIGLKNNTAARGFGRPMTRSTIGALAPEKLDFH